MAAVAVVEVLGYNTWADGSYSFFFWAKNRWRRMERKKYLLSFLPHLLLDGALFVFFILHFPHFPQRKRTKALFFCLASFGLEKGKGNRVCVPYAKNAKQNEEEERRGDHESFFLSSVGGGKKWMEMFSPHFFSFFPDDDVPRFPFFPLQRCT